MICYFKFKINDKTAEFLNNEARFFVTLPEKNLFVLEFVLSKSKKVIMFIEINKLPSTGRVWFYQADRFLSNDEVSNIEQSLKLFINSWLTHGTQMKGSFRIYNNRVIILAADSGFQEASGCSIDSMTRWLKKMGVELDTQFFDRSIGYFKEDKLLFCPVFEVKKYINNGEITSDTFILNQQISSVGELDSSLKILAKDSFLKRHFTTIKNL